MGKYFNVSPATGTGGLTVQEAAVTPTSDFTGRGPVTENVVVEYQDDASVKQTRPCSRTGVKDTISQLVSTFKFQRVASTSDTIPTSGWEDVATESAGGDSAEQLAVIPLAACWVRMTYQINLAACDFMAYASAGSSEQFSKFYVKINGKYLVPPTGALSDSVVEYPQKYTSNTEETMAIQGDPGVSSRMSVEVIAKVAAVTDYAMNLMGNIWADSAGQDRNNAPIVQSIIFSQSSDASGLSVTPASLDFGTSTAKKKISIMSNKPWKAYME